MDWIEQTYQPHFSCSDLLRDVEAIASDFPSRPWDETHWRVWRDLTKDCTGVKSQHTQTDPCIWNGEQLEVLRRCKIEMAKYIKQLESLCEEQKERCVPLLVLDHEVCLILKMIKFLFTCGV